MTPRPEAQTPGGNRASAEEKEGGADQSTASISDTGEARKRLARLKAELALRGYCVHRLASGPFLISRWALSRELPDLAAVERFLAQVEGVR